MNSKKDPGKFTIRFNIADPKQQEVVETLNKQGRYKAQFITNAVLYYVHSSMSTSIYTSPASNNEEIKRIVCGFLSQQQAASLQALAAEADESSNADSSVQLNDADRDAILNTIRNFQHQ